LEAKVALNKPFLILLSLVLLAGAATPSAAQKKTWTFDSVSFNFNSDECQLTQTASGVTERMCPGAAGYKVLISGPKNSPLVFVITPRGKKLPVQYWDTSAPEFKGLRGLVIWEVQKFPNHQVPLGLSFHVDIDDDFNAPFEAGFTVIVKVTPKSACVVARLPNGPGSASEQTSVGHFALGLPCLALKYSEQRVWFPIANSPAVSMIPNYLQKHGDAKLAARVRAEFMHAWKGYKKYAWGHDDLRPLSKTYHDWYGQSLLMTPVDALDTMIMMGLKDEARATREYIVQNLSFDKDIYVQNFEVTIRLLGGLLSSYQLTGDKRLLVLAEDLGTRLLPAFESPTGMPYRFVNLKTGKVRDPDSNPAETGTLLIEFGTLSKLTKKPIFYDKAKRALVETYKRRSAIGLVGDKINVESGEWKSTDSHISGAIDSYYEYLLKSWLLFGDQDCKEMWNESIAAVNTYLADEFKREPQDDNWELWFGHADMNTGKRAATTYGALDAFFPAVLALSKDTSHAQRLLQSSFTMWKRNGIEPEEFNYRTMEVVHAGYPLRPEIVESTFYVYHSTLDPRYFAMGKTLFADFVKHCKTDEGYASLKSVVTKEKADSMHSFLFAETFKYFYLLFAPPDTVRLDTVFFNTEAHPIRKTW
jgi:ER degradation enhancer, mannosidase alpha-like 2